MPSVVPREELLALLALGQALGEPVSLVLVSSLWGPAEGSGGPAPSWAFPSCATVAEPGPVLLVPPESLQVPQGQEAVPLVEAGGD